jgi:predicted aspartyl protease
MTPKWAALEAPVWSDTSIYAVPTRRDHAGRIVAAVMINDKGPFRFMLDTGSNHTALAQSVLSKLGLTADDGAPIEVTGVAGAVLAPSVHIDAIDAGDLHFHDLRLPVLTGPVLRGLDGILGMDGLDGLKLTADFVRDHTIISRSEGKRAPLIYSVVPVEFLSELLPMAQGTVGGVPVKVIIDTGSMSTLGNEALLTALHAESQRRRALLQTRVIDATDSAQPTVIGQVTNVELGAVEVNTMEIAFGQFHIFDTWNLEHEPAMLIGMDVLGTLSRLSIDYRRREVDMQPSERPQLLQHRWWSLEK